jgi:hypothetical protein
VLIDMNGRVVKRWKEVAAVPGPLSLKQTGASVGWGIDDPREMEGWAQGIRLLEEWYFTQDPDLCRLSLGHRLAYKLEGTFKMVQRAHRIVPYQLG